MAYTILPETAGTEPDGTPADLGGYRDPANQLAHLAYQLGHAVRAATVLVGDAPSHAEHDLAATNLLAALGAAVDHARILNQIDSERRSRQLSWAEEMEVTEALAARIRHLRSKIAVTGDARYAAWLAAAQSAYRKYGEKPEEIR